jgi:hypothetical protein
LGYPWPSSSGSVSTIQGRALGVGLAQSLDLCPGGSFALRRGLTAFLNAYNDALASLEEFDIDLVVQGIVQAVGASLSTTTLYAAPSSTTPVRLRSAGSSSRMASRTFTSLDANRAAAVGPSTP